MSDIKTALQEFVATYNDPKVAKDIDKTLSYFPELKGLDKNTLSEYIATYEDPKVNGDWEKVNSYFPEFFADNKTQKTTTPVNLDDNLKLMGVDRTPKPQAENPMWLTPELEKQAKQNEIPQGVEPLSPEESKAVVHGDLRGTAKVGDITLDNTINRWEIENQFPRNENNLAGSVDQTMTDVIAGKTKQAKQTENNILTGKDMQENPIQVKSPIEGIDTVNRDQEQIKVLTNTFDPEQVAEENRKPGFRDFYKAYWDKLNEGFASGFSGLAYMGEMIYNDISDLTNYKWTKPLSKLFDSYSNTYRSIGDFFKNDAEFSRDRADIYKGKDYVQLMKEGRPLAAAGQVYLEATASAPTTLEAIALTAAGAPQAALPLFYVQSAGQKYDELRDKDMNKLVKGLNIHLTGLLEAATERFGDVVAAKAIVSKFGADKVKQAATNVFEKWIAQSLEKSALLTPTVMQGVSEAANSLGQQFVDLATGVDTKIDGKEILDSFVLGIVGGAQFGAIASAKGQYDKIKAKKQAETTFNDADRRLTAMLSRNGFTAEEVQDIKNSMLQATPENRNSVVVAIAQAIPEAITRKDGKVVFNPEISDVFTDFYIGSDKLQSVNKAYNETMEAERAETIRLEKENAAQELQRLAGPDGMIRTVKLKDGTTVQVRGESMVFDENGMFDMKNSSTMLYYTDEAGQPKMMKPYMIESLVEEKPIEQAAMEADQLIDQEISDKEIDEFLPIEKPNEIEREDGIHSFRYNPETKEIIGVLLDEQSGTPKGEPYVIDMESYSQLSGKPMPEAIKTTENEPVNEGGAPIVSGDMTENAPEAAPKYPVNKKGEVDVDAMTVAQTYQYMVDNYGQQEAVEALQLQEKNTQAAIQANIKATDKFKNGQYAEVKKATTIQEQLKIREKHKAIAQKLTDERAVLDAQLAEIRALMPQVEQAPAQPEVKAVTSSNVRPEVQFRREQEAKAAEQMQTRPEVAPITEAEQQPVVEVRAKEKNKNIINAWQRRLNNLGDAMTVEDVVLRRIAGGAKFVWTANAPLKGMADELGFANKPGERELRKSLIDNKNGMTPQEFAHVIYESGDLDFMPGIEYQDIYNAVLDTLLSVNSATDAMKTAERLRDSREFSMNEQAEWDSMTEAEMQYLEEIPDDILESYLGITNFTPEQLDIIQNLQNEYYGTDTTTTETSAVDSTQGIESEKTAAGTTEEPISKEQQFDLTPAENFEQFEANVSEILKQYSGREMAFVQVELYLNEKPEFGKQFIDKYGITNREELRAYTGKLQAKLREGKGKERSEFLKSEKEAKAEKAVSEIEAMALKAEADMQEQINQLPDVGKMIEKPVEAKVELSDVDKYNGKTVYRKGLAYKIDVIPESERNNEPVIKYNKKEKSKYPAISITGVGHDFNAVGWIDEQFKNEYLLEQPEAPKYNNGDTVTYKGKQYTVNGIYAGNKEVDLEDENGNLIHEEVPVSELNQSEQPAEKQSSGNKLPEQAEQQPKQVDVAGVFNSLNKKGEAKLSENIIPDKVSAAQAEADAALQDFLDAFNDLNSDNLGIVDNTAEKQAKMLVAGTKMVGAYTKLGVYKFADLVSKLAEKGIQITEDLLSAIKKSYGAFAAENDIDELDDMKTVRQFTINDIQQNKNEELTQPENNSEESVVSLQGDKKAFISAIKEKLGVEKLNIVAIRKIAAENGFGEIKDTTLQEHVELALIEKAKEIVSQDTSSAEKYQQIVALYNAQPTISMRSSERIEKQQYSTPLPLSFIAGEFVNIINPQTVLEPSAGNGMMVFNVDSSKVIANEIDTVRLENLREQPFKEVTNQDGTLEFNIEPVDGVITNPPFGKSEARDYEGYKIAGLDEQMVVNALSSMADHGRAAIIIGGHTKYKENGTLASEKAFLNYLYDKYNVVDIINVDGGLYSKQGTTYPVRLILVNGRRTGFEALQRRYAPLQKNANSEPVKTFDDLRARVKIRELYLNVIKDNENNLLPTEKPVDITNGNKPTNSNTGIVSTGTAATNRPGSVGQGESGTTSTRPSQNGRPSDKPTKPSTINDAGGSDTKPIQGSGESATNESTARPTRRISTQDADKFLNRGNARPEPLKVDLEKEKTQYPARSKSAQIGSVVPTNVAQTINEILHKFDDIDAYVQTKLGYESKDELFNALAAEQIDSVALAIYQIENGKALIIGDMTGVGKGRQAAAIIRYAVMSGKRPIFITEKPQLFSDIYRDLRDIGSADLNPFILNSKGNEDPAMTDENGVVIYNTPKDAVKKQILASGKLPEEYDYAVLTYSQLNGNVEKKGLSAKQSFFRNIAADNILVLDESHNAGGEGNTGTFMTETLPTTKGVVFLSGTFAKRADNMPIYAMKTSMNEANMSETELIEAIKTGGIPLQEIMSKNLTETGQMVRRERDFTGVTIDWQTMTDKKEQHWKTFDGVIELFNELIKFQKDYIDPVIEAMNDDVADVQGTVDARTGTRELGISNQPFASKTFNLVRQMLFSLKAQEVADEAIKELKAGNKPVIAIGNTMETFINDIGAVGTTTDKHDYSLTLVRGLTGLFRVTETDANGERIQRDIDKSIIGAEGLAKYAELEDKINKLSSGISISPIDVIKTELSKAGYSVGEMTGRTNELVFNEDGTATVSKRTNTDKKKLARDFNSGNIDVLILNQSASTGISLHASNKFRDQRKRVMLFAQNQLDVNTEVQMRGRIDRTGQVQRGAYRYIISPIPAEQRMIMMFKAKLKSLDANTTSSQKSKTNEIEVVDFLNKYGDEIVIEYLKENPDINLKMLDPFNLADKSEDELAKITSEVGAASKAAGRAALLSVKEQEAFYNEITEKYNTLINYLNDAGANDLEITTLPLKAETKAKHIVIQGKNSGNPFSEDSVRETVEVDVLKKPMTIKEVNEEIQKLTEGKTAVEYRDALITKINDYTENQVAQETQKIQEEIGKKQESFFAKAEKEADKGKLEGEARNEFMDAKRQDFDAMMQLHIDTRTNSIRNRAQTILRTIKSLPVGKVVLIPSTLEIGTDTTYSEGMFLGFRMKEKLTPSTITAVFATLDGRRRIDVPLSKVPFLQAVYSQTMQNIRHIKATPENWDSMIPTRTRKTAYIITGNILQAYGRNELRGQLVSYSTVTGEIRQGILLPDKYKSDEQTMRVQVIDRINDLRNGQALSDVSNGVTIRKETPISYSISVPLSKVRGGKYFLDAGLRELVYQNDFRQMAGQMVGMVSENKIEEALRYLSDKFNISVDVAIKKVDENIVNAPQSEYQRPLPATIEVDGVERPTTNSTGKPIHSTEEGIRNFWRWFGESKVVDNEGRPLVVYHGTTKNFNSFKDEFKGTNTAHDKDNVGYHFTSDPKYADTYNRIWQSEGHIIFKEMFGYEPAATPFHESSTIPAYLKISKPNIIEPKAINKELIAESTNNNNDGIISTWGGQTEYVAFYPTQIKSATGNNGEFNVEDANILHEPTQTLLNFTPEETKDETEKAYGSEEKQQEAIDKTIAEAEKLQIKGNAGLIANRRPEFNSPVLSKRTVLDSFKESGYVDFIGQVIHTHQDIADMWSIHRSPYIEKAHVIFVNDKNEIVGTIATTSNHASQAQVTSPSKIIEHAQKVGATGIYMLHNHPSGNPTQSSQDVKATFGYNDYLSEAGIELKGHLVLDHDKYTFIEPSKAKVSVEWREIYEGAPIYDKLVEQTVSQHEYSKPQTRLFTEREAVGQGYEAPARLFEIGKNLLSEPTYKAAIIYLQSTPKEGFNIAAYDIVPEGATKEDIVRIVNEGLKNNLGASAVIAHDGSFGESGWRNLNNRVLDVINTKNESHYFSTVNEPVEKYELWVRQVLGEYGARNLDAAEEATIRLDNLAVAKEMEKGKIRKPLFEDEHGKQIVYDNGDFRIAVNDINNATYVTLWHKEVVKGKEYWARRGELYAGETNQNKGDNGEYKGKYLSIRSVEIEKEYRGLGLGKKLYKALEDYSGDDIKGIYSYLPNRVNKREVPTIYRRMNAKVVDGDHQFVNFNKKTFTPAEIRLATGWERGVDGLWRYEVPDGNFKNIKYSLSEIPNDEAKLSDIWDDDKLFTAYPQLKDITVKINNNTGYGGSYIKESNTIEINLLKSVGKEGQKSTLIHEIQHAIQEIEGFAQGGNVQQFEKEGSKKYRLEEIQNQIDAYNNSNEGKQAKEERELLLDKLINKEITQLDFDNAIAEFPLKYPNYNTYSSLVADDTRIRNEKTPQQKYHTLAGEVEARNASARMNFTADERRKRLLSETADVAPEDQIVLMDAVGVSESRPMPKPTPPTFTSRDTFLDRLQANKKYNEELKKWQSENIQDIASQVGETNEVNAKLAELNKAVDATRAKLWEGWADSQKPVKKWQNYLKENGIDFLDTDDYYLRFTMVPSRVEYRFAEFQKKNIDTFVKTIKAFDNKGISYDDLATYAKLKHADEYTEHIAARKKVQVTPDTDFAGKKAIEERIGMTAEEYISEIEALAGQDLIDTFWKQTKAINEFSLDEEVRSGIRSAESAREIKEMFQWYVPLKNHYDLTAEDAFDYSKERGTFFVSAVRKGKGRLSESGDPFSVMASTVRSTIGASEDNVLKQTLLRLAEKDNTGSTSVSKAWFVKVDEEVDEFGNKKPIFELAPEVPYTDTDTQETYSAKVAAHDEKMKQLAEAGEAYQGKVPKLKLGVWIKPTNVREHEVHVMRNGETYLIRFNTSPRIPQAINKVNYRYYDGAIGRTFEEIGKATRFMAAAKTMFRPTFIFITNPLRDIHAGLNLAFIDEGVTFAANVASYIPRAAYTLGRRMIGKVDLNDKYDRALNTYLLNGGKTGISKILELKQVERDLKDRMDKKIHPWDSFKKVYQSISEITENQVRLAVYFAAIDKGYSALKATSMAKEATINFDRKGNGRNKLREIKSMYAFINVGFQALDNIYTKSTKDSATKKRFMASVAINAFAGGVLVSLISSAIASLFGADDDEWLEDFSKLSSFERNANFLVWTPGGVVKYPLGQEFRIYHALGMDFMMLAHGKTTATETAINMLKGLSSLVPYNPIESMVQGSWGSTTADIINPLTELAANRDWMGSRIYKENQSPEQPGYTKVRTNKRGEPYATETMMLLAKALDKATGGDGAKKGWLSPNPDIVEHLLGGYLAGLFTQTMTIAEAGVKADPSEFIPSAIWKSGDDIKQRNSGLNEKYFEAKDEVKEMTRLIKVYNQQLERNENEYKANLINEETYNGTKQSLIEKIEYLQNDEYYKKNAIIKQIGQTEDELPGKPEKQQRQTETQISELKTSIVDQKPIQGYLGVKTQYDALLDKVNDYRKQKVVTGKENPELEEAYARLYGSFGKMKSIHSYVSAIEKQIKENDKNADFVNMNAELTQEQKKEKVTELKQQNAELEAAATEIMNIIINP